MFWAEAEWHSENGQLPHLVPITIRAWEQRVSHWDLLPKKGMKSQSGRASEGHSAVGRREARACSLGLSTASCSHGRAPVHQAGAGSPEVRAARGCVHSRSRAPADRQCTDLHFRLELLSSYHTHATTIN